MKTLQLVAAVALLISSIAVAEIKKTPARTAAKTDRHCVGKKEFAPCKSSETGTESQCVKGYKGKLECRHAGEFCNPSESRMFKKHFAKGRLTKDEQGRLICRVLHKKHHALGKKQSIGHNK